MDTFLPYFAGFFDGEGSIGIYRNNRHKHPGRTLRVQVTQNVGRESTALLKEARLRWGGALTLMNRAYARPAWIWQVNASKGVRALRDFRPWLRVKAEQADIALAYWDERGFVRRSSSGRFLPISETIRRRGDQAEAALKAAKRGEGLDASSPITSQFVGGGLTLPQMSLW